MPPPRVGQGVQFVNPGGGGFGGGAGGGGFGGPAVVGGPGVGNGAFGGGPPWLPPGIAQGGMDGGYGAILGGMGTVDPCAYGGCGGDSGGMGTGQSGGGYPGGYPEIYLPLYQQPQTYMQDNYGSGIPMPYGMGNFNAPAGVESAYGNTDYMIPYSYGGGYAEGW